MPRLHDLPLDGNDGNVSALLWAFTEVDFVHAGLFAEMARRAVEEMKSFQAPRLRVLSDVKDICFWSFHRASAEVSVLNEGGLSIERCVSVLHVFHCVCVNREITWSQERHHDTLDVCRRMVGTLS